MKSKILITGGLGFVGKNLTRALLENCNSEIVIVDDCSNSNVEYDKDLLSNVKFYKLSVCDSKNFLPLLKGVAYIFHLASRGISSGSVDPINDLNVNTHSSLEMLEYLRIEKPRNFKRFIYASTSSIYGNNAILPFNETLSPEILNHYAGSKFLAESYGRLYAQKYNVPTVALRLSNVYGPGQSPFNLYCGVIGKFVFNALLNRPLTIFSCWDHTRDYTFIEDVIDAFILSSKSAKAVGNIYNVGTGVEISVKELINTLFKYFPDINYELETQRDIDNIQRRCVCNKKIYNELGWIPKYDLQKGVIKTIEWSRQFLKTVLAT